MTHETRLPPAPEDPSLRLAAETYARCLETLGDDPGPAEMRAALERMMLSDCGGEGSLLLQSQVLEALFLRLALKGLTLKQSDGTPVRDYVDDDRLDLALRAQRQCRSAFDSLRKIREGKNRK